MIYKAHVSTNVHGDELRFSVQYSAESFKEAMNMAKTEWEFPEYYCISISVLNPLTMNFDWF